MKIVRCPVCGGDLWARISRREMVCGRCLRVYSLLFLDSCCSLKDFWEKYNNFSKWDILDFE